MTDQTLLADAPQPVAVGARIQTLDVLRGVAVLGILAVNAAAFALPMDAAMAPEQSPFPLVGASAMAQWTVEVFFHQKFVTLFSMLFGASIFLVGGERGDEARGRVLRRRLMWLSVNLCTAFLASSVVGHFEGTIDKLVALAVLMPIVAGLGGNAGTQVLALMIRGLALGQVGASNARTLLWKELRVALLNGVVLGTVLGLIVLAWFHMPGLSLVIAIALTFNLLFAASAGVLVPLTLKRLGFDPALASGIFLTAVTDSMGFFTFLGLATLVLLH